MSLVSLYDAASLWMTPSGAEDGKLFSELPTDGSGDFTFSRGSNLAATRVGPTGLIEKGRENLLLQSNNFNTTWITSSVSVTSGQSGYDGTNDAWLLTKTAASGRLYQNLSASGVLTFSVYMKANASTWGLIQVDGSPNDAYVYVDLQNGTTGATSSVNIVEGIEDVGNGWYRVSISINDTATRVRVYPAETNSASATSGSIYIQDAQLELGLAATDYIESGATTGKAGLLEDEPRLDYSGGATCPSLLLEPSRTQLIRQSEYFNDATWTKVGSSVTPNATTSPDGTINAGKLVEDTSTGGHQIQSITSASNSTIYTTSVFVKYAGREWIRFTDAQSSNRIHFNTLTGVFGTISGTVIDYNKTALENGWYKLSFTTTSVAAAYTPRIALSEADNDVVYTGDGTSGIYIWGAQLEAGSYPTSYIPNHSGGSVTRGADLATGAGTSSTFNDSEGVLFIDLKTTKNASPAQITLNDGTYSNRIIFEVRPDAAFIKAFVNSEGSNAYETSVSSAPNTNYKVAIKYSANDIAFFVNGVKEAFTTTTTAMPTGLADLSYTGKENDGALRFTGNVKQTLVFNEALSDAECIKLTTL